MALFVEDAKKCVEKNRVLLEQSQTLFEKLCLTLEAVTDRKQQSRMLLAERHGMVNSLNDGRLSVSEGPWVGEPSDDLYS